MVVYVQVGKTKIICVWRILHMTIWVKLHWRAMPSQMHLVKLRQNIRSLWLRKKRHQNHFPSCTLWMLGTNQQESSVLPNLHFSPAALLRLLQQNILVICRKVLRQNLVICRRVLSSQRLTCTVCHWPWLTQKYDGRWRWSWATFPFDHV